VSVDLDFADPYDRTILRAGNEVVAVDHRRELPPAMKLELENILAALSDLAREHPAVGIRRIQFGPRLNILPDAGGLRFVTERREP